jgi:drug/metabolite transporter (DMT)-like permease
VSNAGPEEKLSGIFMGHLLTAAIGIPFSLFRPGIVSVQAVTSILILGILQLGIPYILMGLASENCPPLACCLIGAVEPLLNPVWVFLFNGERPGITSVIGGAIVIASVTAHCILRDRRAAVSVV